MRPQGYLGRAYAARFGAQLGLPSTVKEWTDAHAMRALLVHGHDLVGNLLIGTIARDQFIATAEPKFIRAYPFEFGVRNKQTGETAWHDLVSVRHAAKALGLILKYI